MKHRSTHIFILVAAILVAAPRASQELSAMKDALNHRLRSEIFNAFLSFHDGDPTRPAAPSAAGQLASAAPRAEAPARPAATHVEVHARREVPAEAPAEVAEVPSEVAAITEPVLDIAALEPAAALAEAADFKFELHDTKVIRGRELAMIIPPDADVTAQPPPPSRRESARRATALKRRAAEFERAATTFKVNVENAVGLKGIAPVELRRQFREVETIHLDPEAARVWTKALKLRGTAPKPAPAPVAPPAPAARAACPKPAASAASAPAPLIGCGPSAVETFYAGE